MAKQLSIIPMKGTLGNLTYYKDSNGYLVKRKGGVPKETILMSPNFVRVRENMSEFGMAAQAGALLRNGIRPLLINAKDRLVASRLVKQVLHIAKTTDTTDVRGARTIASGNPVLLNGFNFNNNAKLNEVLYAPYSVTVDRVAGTITVSVPAFNALNQIVAPVGATDYQLLIGGSEVDFVDDTSNTDISSTAILPLNNAATTPVNTVLSLTAGTTLPLFTFLGVQFYQTVNGVAYALETKESNTLAVVNVNP